MSTFLWILLGVLYLTLFVLLGLATLRKGHYALFFFGIIFPVLWIFGALMGPHGTGGHGGGPNQAAVTGIIRA
jgi:hypothetical protein